MNIVRRRRGLDKKKNEDSEYGFSYPLEVVESLYWERHNSEGANQPDNGGMLDQDFNLSDDLNTYGWLVGLAETVIDKDEELKKLVTAKLGAK